MNTNDFIKQLNASCGKEIPLSSLGSVWSKAHRTEFKVWSKMETVENWFQSCEVFGIEVNGESIQRWVDVASPSHWTSGMYYPECTEPLRPFRDIKKSVRRALKAGKDVVFFADRQKWKIVEG